MNAFKKIILLFCVSASTGTFAAAKADSLGLPGDNFDLYAALELFKKSGNPEAFEKAINSSDNEINNLDLDADGKVDYVKVIDKTKDDSHSLVLQVDVSKTETQDVAVIEIEKTKTDNAHLQIVGDEELYGKNYIIEPADESAKSTTAKTTGTQSQQNYNDDVYATPANNNPPVVVNVWAWPAVQYVYMPTYSVWASPWYWGYYPSYWQPWGPVYWQVYYRRAYRWHQPYYHRTNYYTCNVAHNYYYGRRASSITVTQYNRNGVYEKKQMAYKENVQPGRKYNSEPANAEKQQVINKRQESEPKPINSQPKQFNAENNNTAQPKKFNDQPKEMSQPRQVNNNNSEPKNYNKQPVEEHKQVYSQPKQMNTEPNVYSQPKSVNQQPVKKSQAQPMKTNQGMSSPRQQGGGQMRSGSGGGRRQR